MPRGFGSLSNPDIRRRPASFKRRSTTIRAAPTPTIIWRRRIIARARLEHRQTDLAQAESYYNLCLDRNSAHTDCYRGLAVLLAEQGRNEEAFRLIEGWVQRQPGSADAKIELARLNEEFGNRQVAKEYLIEALAAEPDNPRALTALGKIREDAGDSAQALANYQRSLSQDNRQPQVAARVSALQAGGAAGVPAPAGSAGTRIADRDQVPTLAPPR